MTTLEKTRRTIEKLKKEVEQLRSFVIGIAGKDPEGEYRPEFIKRVKKALKDKLIYEYTGPDSLMRLLKSAKKR